MGTEQHDDMAEIVRAAYRESGMSLKRLNDLAGTRYASTHGFFATCDRDAKLSTVRAWCRVLGLKLVSSKRKRR